MNRTGRNEALAYLLLRARAYRPLWQAQGLCADDPIVDFFPPRGARAAEARAKAVCARCPVQVECRAFAMSDRDAHGVWGGMTEADRREALRRGEQTAA